MSEREQYLMDLIQKAGEGNAEALSDLGSIALGGNKSAQEAIMQIDKRGKLPISLSPSVSTPVVWPRDVQTGIRGPRKGDVALHNDF